MVRYHRKKYTRKRSTLSNYKIATRTSAKAQSRQIYALKKRMNTIYRMTKPEIRIQQRNSPAYTLNANTVAGVTFLTTGSTNSFDIVPRLGTVSSSVINSNPINNFARLRGFNLYGHLEYSTLSATAQPITVRLVIVQTRTTRAEALNANDIFSTAGSDSNHFNAVFGPLQLGLARTCRVLSDKRYVLSYQRPAINMRTNLRRLLSFYRDTANFASTSASSGSESESIAKGTIYVFYACYGNGYTDNPATMNFTYKLAFIDN